MNTLFLSEDTKTKESSFIMLEKESAKFSFKLQAGESKASGYCDLTPEEYEVFDNVFQRIVASAGEPTEVIGDKKIWKSADIIKD